MIKPIKNVCIIDFETTGLDSETDKVVEIGAILYSVEYQTVLQQFSTLRYIDSNPQEPVNKINAKATDLFNSSYICSDYLEQAVIEFMVSNSEFIIAHNAEFDKQWLTVDKPWLCSFSDFIWPLNSKPSNLITTALNHGIGVTKAHRALSDCQLIAELFDRTEDLQGLFEQAIARANEPRYSVIAQVSFDQKDLAKSAGFYWQPGGKLWVKELRESDLNIESSQWQFKFTTEILS